MLIIDLHPCVRVIRQKFTYGGLAIYQGMKRFSWHCYVIVALPDVKKIFFTMKIYCFFKAQYLKK